MKALLAAVLLVGISVGIADADDKPPQPIKVMPDNDARLTKVADAPLQKLGVLTYYPNNGGGYTFLERKHITFYSLPLFAETYHFKHTCFVTEAVNERVVVQRAVVETINVLTIGESKMPFGGQTVYRTVLTEKAPHEFRREDISIATWTRDTPNSRFRLSITSDDHETRLKLKSIVPVLEHAEHGQ
jgi:hypothetical protein